MDIRYVCVNLFHYSTFPTQGLDSINVCIFFFVGELDSISREKNRDIAVHGRHPNPLATGAPHHSSIFWLSYNYCAYFLPKQSCIMLDEVQYADIQLHCLQLKNNLEWCRKNVFEPYCLHGIAFL